jgi:hypothetical protein
MPMHGTGSCTTPALSQSLKTRRTSSKQALLTSSKKREDKD